MGRAIKAKEIIFIFIDFVYFLSHNNFSSKVYAEQGVRVGG